MTKAESPVDRSYRSSSFSMASANSASSGLSNSSSVTAYTSALDTPSTADTFNAQQPPKPHLTVSKPPHLSTVPSETTKSERPSVPLITETVHSDTEEKEDGTVPPLPDMRSRTSSSASSSGSPRDKMARKRRASGQGALKLNLTDDERIAKAQSKIVNLPGRDVDSDVRSLSPCLPRSTPETNGLVSTLLPTGRRRSSGVIHELVQFVLPDERRRPLSQVFDALSGCGPSQGLDGLVQVVQQY